MKRPKWFGKFLYKIAYLLDKSERTCWAELATWPLGMNGIGSCFDGEHCRWESKTHQHRVCYCGKFVNGERFKRDDNEGSRE